MADELSDVDYAYVADLVSKMSGLTLGVDKKYLVQMRLDALAKKRLCGCVSDLIASLRLERDEPLRKEIMCALTTPETLFFRDNLPYDAVRQIMLPYFLSSRKFSKILRIWSAACSFGQEPYSLAMLLESASGNFGDWHIEIVATDINPDTLARARAGVYTDFEVNRGLSEELRSRFFVKKSGGWHLIDAIRNRVEFQEMNLLDTSAMEGSFDIIFCRNVLIYFEDKNKRKVIEKIASLLMSDGFLVMGAAETGISFADLFKRLEHVKTGIYQKV